MSRTASNGSSSKSRRRPASRLSWRRRSSKLALKQAQGVARKRGVLVESQIEQEGHDVAATHIEPQDVEDVGRLRAHLRLAPRLAVVSRLVLAEALRREAFPFSALLLICLLELQIAREMLPAGLGRAGGANR
eukprot:6740959-Prymnesium_polylepis.2